MFFSHCSTPALMHIHFTIFITEYVYARWGCDREKKKGFRTRERASHIATTIFSAPFFSLSLSLFPAAAAALSFYDDVMEMTWPGNIPAVIFRMNSATIWTLKRNISTYSSIPSAAIIHMLWRCLSCIQYYLRIFYLHKYCWEPSDLRLTARAARVCLSQSTENTEKLTETPWCDMQDYNFTV